MGHLILKLKHFLRLIMFRAAHVVFYWFYIPANVVREYKRFIRYSYAFNTNTKNKCLSMITACSHIIEKGLAMPERRLGFGSAIIHSLARLLQQYVSAGYDLDDVRFQAGLQVLRDYIDLHKSENYALPFSTKDFELLIEEYGRKEEIKSTLTFKKEDLLRSGKSNFEDLMHSRYSIRDFDEKPVDPDLIGKAVHLAMRSPSSCNRQSIHTYVVLSRERTREIMGLQNGNRGFGHRADKVLVVTSDLCSFGGPLEANLPYTDAGIFTMGLLCSLHYYGIGACTLNWCVSPKRDEELRRLIGVPDNETIVLLICLGNVPDLVNVPRSCRKKRDEVLHWVE